MRSTKYLHGLITCFVVLPIVALSACTAVSKVEKADSLANAGVAFADSVPAFIDESFVLAVTANSLTLKQSRSDLTEEERIVRLQVSDDLLAERLTILRDLKRHALLLRSYFIAIKAIIQSDAASGITDQTKNIVMRLGELSPTIKDASIGGTSISDFIEPAVKLVIASYQNTVLRRELDARADAIERELALQQAALSAIRDQMIADKDLQVQIEERNPIFEDFVGSASLPGNWSDQRVTAFKKTIGFESYDIAAKAASGLHENWIAFAEDRLDERTLLLLIRDIEALVQLSAKLTSAD